MYKKLALVLSVLLIAIIGLAPLASADDLDKLKAAGELRIAMSGVYPPFSFINEKNEVVGFDPAIGREIARRMGLKPVIITITWDGIIAGLLANKFDTVVGSMGITEKRMEVVDFVGPYYRSGRGVFIRKDENFTSLSDFAGKNIGVNAGEVHENFARKQEGWKVITYKGVPELLLEIQNKRIDAFVLDSIPGMMAIKKGGAQIKKMDLPNIEGAHLNIGIAIRKNNPKLQAAMQKALDDIMADGTYTKIATEWVGYDIR
jgi:polar amino acid transport system substrate-binding protein